MWLWRFFQAKAVIHHQFPGVADTMTQEAVLWSPWYILSVWSQWDRPSSALGEGRGSCVCREGQQSLSLLSGQWSNGKPLVLRVGMWSDLLEDHTVIVLRVKSRRHGCSFSSHELQTFLLELAEPGSQGARSQEGNDHSIWWWGSAGLAIPWLPVTALRSSNQCVIESRPPDLDQYLLRYTTHTNHFEGLLKVWIWMQPGWEGTSFLYS